MLLEFVRFVVVLYLVKYAVIAAAVLGAAYVVYSWLT